jgi:hypothetical protein
MRLQVKRKSSSHIHKYIYTELFVYVRHFCMYVLDELINYAFLSLFFF